MRLQDGSELPRFADVCDLVRSGAQALVELKTDGDDPAAASLLAETLFDALEPLEHRMGLMSFDAIAVAALKRSLPSMAIGLLIAPASTTRPQDRAAEAARLYVDLDLAFIAPHLSTLAAIQASSPLTTAVWTVRDEASLLHARRHHAVPIFEGISPKLAIATGAAL